MYVHVQSAMVLLNEIGILFIHAFLAPSTSYSKETLVLEYVYIITL